MKAWAVVNADEVGGAVTEGYTVTKCGGGMVLPHLSIFLHRPDAAEHCRDTKAQRVIRVKISEAK